MDEDPPSKEEATPASSYKNRPEGCCKKEAAMLQERSKNYTTWRKSIV
jgi:hypothetical protein